MTEESPSPYVATYEAVVRAGSVEKAVVLIRDNYGLDHATYHHARIIGDIDAPYVKSTYPAQWLARYLLRGYLHVDPVVREGFSRQLPFDWRELTMTRDAHDLMLDALAHGLGGFGYSIPLVDKQVRRALFSINSGMPADEWDTFIKRHARGLAELAARIHRMAISELYGGRDPVPQLGPRELECLTWAARGKDYKAIAQILSISENTVRDYLKTARLRLDGATIAQAVAKAIKLQLIRL
jgi:DNA-binding CsgD family transcriptional regulator